MADNVTHSTGDLIAADDLGGSPAVKVQRIKVTAGREGEANDVNLAFPLATFLGDSSSLDSMGRLRVASSVVAVESSFRYDKQPLVWAEKTVGAGAASHLPNDAAVSLTASTASGDSVVRQTRRYIAYRYGKSHLAYLSFYLGTAISNARKRIGLFDANNGVFLEETGGTVTLVLRSKVSGSVVDAPVAKSSWNIDKLDGSPTSPSGQTLDLTKVQTLAIDFVPGGRVRVGFVIAGRLSYVHQFLHANVITSLFAATMSLPLRYEMVNIATTLTGPSMKQHECCVVIEGGADPGGLPFSAGLGAVEKTVGTSTIPVLAVRPAAAFSTIENRTEYFFDALHVYTRVNECYFALVLNPSLTGAAYGAVHASSSMEVDTTATATTGGQILAELYLGLGHQTIDLRGILGHLGFGLDVDGTTPTVLAVVAQGRAASASAHASIRWHEQR